jgi:DNA-binding NarL/FixJ family response regulator
VPGIVTEREARSSSAFTWRAAAVPKREAGRSARIMIVDDHPITRSGLAALISPELDMEVCAEAAEAQEALEKVEKLKPDLIVIDISLGKGIGGVELVKEIKSRSEKAKMLVWSMHDEKLFTERCLNAGALGYISKDAAPKEFLAAIRRVLQGKIYVSEQMSDLLLHRMLHGDERLDRPSVESLSDRELQIFELIGKGMTTKQIAENLHLSVKTIETYRENIKVKLNLKNSAELVRHAVQWTLEGN